MNYQKLLQRAQKEKNLIPQIIGTLIIFNSEQIVEGIRRRWLFGKSSNQSSIGEYRSSEYKAFKVGINPRAGGDVDLTLTGALGNGLIVKKSGDLRYEIISTDWKFGKISKKYGVEQFNLDERQLDELLDTLFYFALVEYLDNVYLI